jgi:hypothetical protein
MPITSQIEPEQQLAVFWHVGDVPDEELLTFYGEFLDDPRAADCLNLLVHLEETRSTGRSSQALRALAGLLEERWTASDPHRRVAVVAPIDVSYGLARMYEALSDRVPWEFCVFRDVAAARVWLGC